MADTGIDWLLRLQAKFDSITGATSAVERLDASTQKAQRTADSFTAAESRVSAATQDLVDRLTPMQQAFNDAFTDNQADASINRLEKSMARLGLVWTSEAAEINSADLLATNSLEQLAQKGLLTADAIAENASAQKDAASAVQQHENALTRLTTAFNRAQNPLDGVTKKLTRMALSFFTVRKLVRYLINAVSRAPDEIGSSLTALKTQISDNFARVTVSALAGMQKGLDRLKAAMDSPGGQRLMRGLENAARLAGEAIGILLDKVASVVEWLGDHFQQAATVAALALAVFGGQALFAAAATLAANWPVLLLVASMGVLVSVLEQSGVTAEQIFTGIGQAAGWLYATVHNLVADAWNLFAGFAEFFANVFNDPLSAVAHLFVDVFDTIVGVVETAARAIDALLGSNMAAAVSGFRNNLQSWADATLGAKKITIARMDKISNADTMTAWGNKAESIATSFSLSALDAQTPQAIKAIKSDTGAIRKSVNMAEEDLKSLVDYATRRFVAEFNLQHLAPQITINGQNTGNTAADAEALAETIKQMLIEQTASGTYYATAMP